MSKRIMSFIFAYWEIGFFIYFLSFDNFGKLISLIFMLIPVAYYNRKRLIKIFNGNEPKIEITYDDFEEILIEKIEDYKYNDND